MTLPHGGLPEVVSSHLIELIKKTGGKDGPIGRQFIARPSLEKKHYDKSLLDPLNEDAHEVAPGLIYKYKGIIDSAGKVVQHRRALFTITRFCASFCRFCTRGREVGLPSSYKPETFGTISQKTLLSDEDIKKVLTYLKKHREINEVILSGGDPLTTPSTYLAKIIEGLVSLQNKGDIDIIRIATRLPIHNPNAINNMHYQLIGKIKNPYLLLHINHPAELTPKTLHVIYEFRKKSLATVLSQTVLLKGVNDSVETLQTLFEIMAKEGIRPYYLHQNDTVYWAKHFTVPIKKAIKIWQELRPRLSGVAATAKFVIDCPNGVGKIAIPEGNAWDVNYSYYYDFNKNKNILK